MAMALPALAFLLSLLAPEPSAGLLLLPGGAPGQRRQAGGGQSEEASLAAPAATSGDAPHAPRGSRGRLSVRLRRAPARPAAEQHAHRGALLQLGARSSGHGPPVDHLMGTIYVGMPQKEFNVAFDTGSGNVILPSVKCKSVSCISHNTYDDAMSGKSRDIARIDDLQAKVPQEGPRETVRLRIGRGEVVGQLMSDRVCLGAEESLCAQTGIVEATEMSQEPFASLPYDGILGLGMPGVSLRKHFNLMGNLAEEGELTTDRFAVWLAAEGDSEDSEITFGELDEARVGSPEVMWQHLAKPESGQWQLTMSDVYVGMKEQNLCVSGNCLAVFDTGTNVIGGPKGLVERLAIQLKVKEDCSNFGELPMIGFAFQEVVVNLDPADYVRRTDEGLCYLQIMGIDIPPPRGPLWLLGHPFLRRYYTVYDRPTLQLGFALAKHEVPATVGGWNETIEQTSARLVVPRVKAPATDE